MIVIKFDSNKKDLNYIKIESFISDINENPDLLDYLSNDRLLKLKHYLIKDIIDKEKQLKF